LPAAAE